MSRNTFLKKKSTIIIEKAVNSIHQPTITAWTKHAPHTFIAEQWRAEKQNVYIRRKKRRQDFAELCRVESRIYGRQGMVVKWPSHLNRFRTYTRIHGRLGFFPVFASPAALNRAYPARGTPRFFLLRRELGVMRVPAGYWRIRRDCLTLRVSVLYGFYEDWERSAGISAIIWQLDFRLGGYQLSFMGIYWSGCSSLNFFREFFTFYWRISRFEINIWSVNGLLIKLACYHKPRGLTRQANNCYSLSPGVYQNLDSKIKKKWWNFKDKKFRSQYFILQLICSQHNWRSTIREPSCIFSNKYSELTGNPLLLVSTFAIPC